MLVLDSRINSRTAAGRIVAAAGFTTASNGDTRERKVRAAIGATKNIVVFGVIGSCACHISESDSGDSHSVGRLASGAAIEIILLDIDTVVCDSRDGDVLVNDVADLYISQY